MSKEYRNEYDLIKVFATLLVVLGHITILYDPQGSFPFLTANPFCTIATRSIYLFHMPLFMAVSGMIYALSRSKKRYREFKPFIKNKATRLLIPYFCVGLLFLVPVLTATGIADKSLQGGGIDLLKGVNNRHLWYLYALFWIFMLVYWIDKMRIPLYLSFPISIAASVAGSLWGGTNDWFCLHMALYYLPFFLFGVWLSSQEISNNRIVAALTIGLAAGVIIRIQHIPAVDSVFSLLLPCCIIYLLISAVKKIDSGVYARSSLFRLLQRNSFAIYLFHIPVIYIIYDTVGSKIHGLIMLPIAFVVSIALSCLLAQFLRKAHLLFILGENGK